jgi:translation initiation factor IF-2
MIDKTKKVERRATPRLKKAEADAQPPAAPIEEEERAAATPPTPGHGETAANPSGPKRAVLKTIKRATASPPPSPTLHRVTVGGLTRRVVPKAPPKPKVIPVPPKPPEPPVAEPETKLAANTPVTATPPTKDVAAAPVVPPTAPTSPKINPPSTPVPSAAPKVMPSPGATPIVKPPSPTAPKEPPRKEGGRLEPTVTYKMPSPSPIPIRPARPASGSRPSSVPGTAASAASAPAASTEAKVADAATAAPRRKIRVPEVLTVKDLADRIGVKPIDVIKKLLGLGSMVTINQQLDPDVASIAADAFAIDLEIVPVTIEQEAEVKDDPASLKPRAPIVTIMGHVDHGKTSLLDAIRKTRVAEREAGGITQHIGAYRVPTSRGDVVFLDTPGHEAFTAMRARGAQVTDIVVLVVAADDGVMPQTVEAIDHAKAAGVTIVVAVNKIDLPTADVERIKRDLTQYKLVPEEWGGKTVFVEVSAKKGTNVDKLLEMLGLESELLELKANPDRPAQGVVVEAKLDPRRGVAATLLVQRGTLRVGDVVVAGTSYGRTRALLDDRANRITEAGPATPVEVLGLTGVPQAGDKFVVMADEREGRAVVERRQTVMNEEAFRRKHVTLETLHARVAEGKIRELKVILKADVQGSVQAIRDALERISSDQIRLNVIHAAVGAINETDVTLADASDAVIIGFNVRPDAKAEEAARRQDVDLKTYRIIYEAIADIRAAMEGLLEPETTEVKIGRAEVRQVFRVTKGGTIAGSFVIDGKMVRGAKCRVIRDGVVVHEGAIDSLKRFKDDAREVEKGFECGIGLGNFQDIKSGDVVEAFTHETKARKLEEKS